MAGQMVTLTLMTTAESGVPADWARAGGAREAGQQRRGESQLEDCVSHRFTPSRGQGRRQLFNIHAMRVRRIRQKVRRMAGPVVLDARGGAWNESKSSSWAAGRSAWRSPCNSGCAASPARWWKAAPSSGASPRARTSPTARSSISTSWASSMSCAPRGSCRPASRSARSPATAI